MLASHPEWLAWCGLAVALLCIYQSLGLADPGIISRWMTGDTLWLVNVFTDLFHDGYSLAGWHFSIAPCWFPDVAAAGLFWGITRNVIVATLLAGFIQVGIIVAALHVIGKVLGVRSLALQDSILLLVGTAIALYVARDLGVTYQGFSQFFLPQTHVGSMLSVLWGWALALLIVCRRREGRKIPRPLILAYAGLCLLAGMSNLLFFPHMLVSISAALLLGVFFGVVEIHECWLPIATGWLFAAVGAVLNRVLFTATDVKAESGVSYERALTALDTFMRGFVAKVLTLHVFHIGALLWVAICAGYIAWTVRALIVKGRAKVSSVHIMRAVFFTTCLFASLLSVASIILGGSHGLVELKDYVWSMHYLHLTFLFPLFAIPMALSWAIEKIVSVRVVRATVWLAAASAFVVPAAQLATMPFPKVPISAYQPPLVRFLDQTAAATPIHYGLAGYWQARLITMLSKSGLRVYAINPDFSPFLWVNNEQWYRQSLNDRTRPPQYDFVVLDDPMFKISREAAIRVFGEPQKELRLGDTRVLIYSGQH